jgi:hypothetical protein
VNCLGIRPNREEGGINTGGLTAGQYHLTKKTVSPTVRLAGIGRVACGDAGALPTRRCYGWQFGLLPIREPFRDPVAGQFRPAVAPRTTTADRNVGPDAHMKIGRWQIRQRPIEKLVPEWTQR